MRHLLKLFAIFTIASFVIVACSDEESPTDTGDNGEDNEYEATAEDFDGYSDWKVINTSKGPDPANLGPDAHGGNDSTVTRTVYINEDVNRENGEYPVGTIIVKDALNPDKTYEAYTAMVKRGGDFNPDGNDWEWFMLTPDGQIAQNEEGEPVRGAIGTCIGCHNKASDKDFVFSSN